MAYRRDQLESATRRKARHERDDASPRLLARVPRLQSLYFEIEASERGATVRAARHVKRFVVDHAPALFVIHCTDPECADGEHDLTERILKQLAAGKEKFGTEDPCKGRSGACTRIVRVTAVATYAPAARGAK